MDDAKRRLAVVELLGALAYGQLRSFEATARAVGRAPTVRDAQQIADLAVAEHAGHRRLVAHLEHLTELPAAVMERQRAAFDAYFDRAPTDDWLGVCVFTALGLPMAGDFARAVSSTLDDDSASVVAAALERRDEERAALARLEALVIDDDVRERARKLAGDLLGRALTGFQGVMGDTDALQVLLRSDRREGESGEQRVKRLVMAVLDGHRRRVVELGLEGLGDVS